MIPGNFLEDFDRSIFEPWIRIVRGQGNHQVSFEAGSTRPGPGSETEIEDSSKITVLYIDGSRSIPVLI